MMTSRFRTSCRPTARASRNEGGAPGLRLRAGTAGALFAPSALFLFLCIILFALPAWAAHTPAGTVIENAAHATFTDGAVSGLRTAVSNTVSTVTVIRQTTATVEFLQYAPAAPGAQSVNVQPAAYSPTDSLTGPFSGLSAPVPVGSTTPLNLGQPIPLTPAEQYHAGEPVFIRLTDQDQDNDPTVAETVVVTLKDEKTGDVEVLQLTETGPNTGVFAGSIQTSSDPAQSGNGVLNVASDSRIIVSYDDNGGASNVETASAMIDPFGIVFNSATGAPVDGATVTLVDVTTGNPAVVYGDDGVSTYPATVTTGGTAMDSAGRVYSFSPGGYRYPFIKPGAYRLVVTPPVAYRAPSQVATAALQNLPGGPFAIADPGSRGEAFTLNPGPAMHIDIPVDPISSRLYLRKTAGKQTAAIGDFIPYTLNVENIDTIAPVPGVSVADRLPVGFRYRSGSARLNGVATADPAISADGRTLTFTVGDLGPAGKAQIDYVAQVGVGVRPGPAVNTASASGTAGAVSNSVSAMVQVTDDLFGEKAVIAGRVLVDGCGNKEAAEKGGLAGVRVYLEDGTYAVTDAEGKYHFEAVQPGDHVVQIDTGSLPERYEALECERNTRFAGSAFSQFADVQGGTLWRADFHLGLKPRGTGEVGLELRTRIVKGADDGTPAGLRARKDTIQYLIPVHVGAVPARDGRLVVLLPAGALYVPATSRLNAAPVPDPEIAAGSLTYRIADLPAGWEGSLRFNALIPVVGTEGDLDTKAMLLFDTPHAKNVRTPVVVNTINRHQVESVQPFPDVVIHPHFSSGSPVLGSYDRRELNRLIKDLRKVDIRHITITGYTDNQKIKPYLRAKYPDNYALSFERAGAVGDYLASALSLTPGQVTYFGKGPDDPIADNGTIGGRARNRRVELKVETGKVVTSSAIKDVVDASGMQAVATVGLRPGETWAADDPAEKALSHDMPDYDAAWLKNAQPGLAWLWPAAGFHPAIPSVKIAIKHDPMKKLKLFLNGAEVDPLNFDGEVKRSDNLVAVSTWRGVDLQDGDNLFEVVEYDASGKETARIKRMIHYSTQPVKAELDRAQSRLTADGKNPPVLAIRLTDKDGQPAREGVIGEYSVDPPRLPYQRQRDLQAMPLTASTSDQLKYTVGEDGIARIRLAPTTDTGDAVVRLKLGNGEQTVSAWLTPEKRDWVLVGLAKGTVGYNTVTGNMESLGAAGGDQNYYENGRVAFYAKGMIKGEWLLTMAYDSAKNTGGQSMFQTVDPNQYYLLYGDATDQRYDAASSQKVYVKLERGQFYALFGDYDTGLSVTELSRYERRFTGVKSEWKGRHAEYTAFLSRNDQAFVRDEIPGDGTSGLYRLSRTNIVLNSETVTIQTRDRFQSEVIVSQQQLTRYLDYDIDYQDGTIWFKSPIFSRDANFNPIYIVVEYESFDASDMAYTYGGRGAVKALDNRLVLGATHVHEGRTGGYGELNGVDASADLGSGTKVRAEAASTRTEQTNVLSKGSAYLAEVQHTSERLQTGVYVREEASGFGLGMQNGSESATRKMGGDLNYRISKPWSAGVQAFRQETLSTGARSDMAEVRGNYLASERLSTDGGVRYAADSFGTGQILQSDQLFAGARYQLTKRTSLRLEHDQSLGQNGSVNYPTRTTFGADYKLNETATLFADEEYAHGDQATTATSRVGLRASPWTGGSIGSTLEQQDSENGQRLFSTLGLKQTWQITQAWSVDGGLDRSDTLSQAANPVTTNPNVLPASGDTEDFTAVSLGTGYRQARWSWSARAESRHAQLDQKFTTFMGANGDVRDGLAVAGGVQTFRDAATTGLATFTGDVRLGLAYRPAMTRYIVLDRLDLVQQEQHGSADGTSDYNNQRVVNNFVMNYKTGVRTQVSAQYGAKYVQETIGANDYRGYTDLTGLEGRYDLTERWDLGLRGMLLHSWALDQSRYGAGLSTGFTAGKNVWVSVGYNFAGFTDRDFSQSDFTCAGPYLTLRLKFDQVSAREAVRWITGQ